MLIWALGVLIAVIVLLPLAWKWELPALLSTGVVVSIGTACGGIGVLAQACRGLPIAGVVVLQALLAPTLFAAFLLARFFRDPPRACRVDRRLVMSPADGRVVYVKPVKAGVVPLSEKRGRSMALSEFAQTPLLSGDGVVVGIGMSFVDVHVNRAPISGTVTMLKHIGGLFRSLKHSSSVLENERVLTMIEDGPLCIGVVQIASRLVRQIIPYVQVGRVLNQGDRIGRITFGSQVDVIIPTMAYPVRLMVKPGDRVTAGKSRLAVFDV